MKQSLINQMQEMGFTAYEAKAYVTLLQNNPATGYEVSAKSEVPRSAIYDVLKRLESVGLVNAVHAKPRRYIPLPPEKMLSMLQEKFDKSLDSLRKGLEEFDSVTEYSDLWHLQGYENMINKANQMIRSAKTSIFLSTWTSEVSELEQALLDAETRGIRIVIFSFTEMPVQVGKVYSYNVDQEKLEEIWDRKIVLIVDRNEVLMGEADRKNSKSVVWTHNPAIITIALNHIVLDITLFGQRYNIPVDDTVNEMMNGSGGDLDKLLTENELETDGPVIIN